MWKSWRALLVAESMGGLLAKGCPAGRRGREPIRSCGTGEHWTAGTKRGHRCTESLPPRNRGYLRRKPHAQYLGVSSP